MPTDAARVSAANSARGTWHAESLRMHNDKRIDLLAREGLLRLLSDDEIARVSTAEADTRLASGDEYINLPMHVDGYIESEALPGLRLDPVAMTGADMATVAKVLQGGIASPRYRTFVDGLTQG